MARLIQGDLKGEGLSFGIVVSRFNDFITERLLQGALDELTKHGVEEEDITVVKVPGAFEVPLIAKKMAESKKYHAVICLCAVIRGATPHFEHISTQLSRGIASVALETEVPLIYGVITADTIEQAVERAGTKMGNKGADAARAAIEMANLIRGLSPSE